VEEVFAFKCTSVEDAAAFKEVACCLQSMLLSCGISVLSRLLSHRHHNSNSSVPFGLVLRAPSNGSCSCVFLLQAFDKAQAEMAKVVAGADSAPSKEADAAADALEKLSTEGK